MNTINDVFSRRCRQKLGVEMRSQMERSEVEGKTLSSDRADTGIAVGVGIAVLALLLVLQPVLGIPRNDDFSYARTAESLAKTGHIAYNGWGSPLMLPQAAIGALIIKIFGFSYYALDWFGVFCAAATAAALFSLCRLTGIRRSACLLAVAVFIANPMFLGTAATFMTDIPSLLLLLWAFIALMTSLTRIPPPPDGISKLKLVPARFWVSVALGIIAGTNRQLSWVAYIGAIIPIFFVVNSKRDRITVAAGCAAVVASAFLVSAWLAEQPMTVPTNVYIGLVLLVGYTDAIFAVVYRFFFIFGLFILPIVIASLTSRDLKRPWLWAAIGVTALPLLFPVSKRLGYFTGFFGAAPSGQYFTSDGVKIGYIVGEEAMTRLLPISVVYLWTMLGILALGISLYLIAIWCSSVWAARKVKLSGSAPAAKDDVVARTIANAFLVSTFAQVAASLPWFAQLHVFDRYFLFYLPGFAIFFLLQVEIRNRVEPVSRGFQAVTRVLAGTCLVSMGILSFAMSATYLNLGRAQAILYHRLLSRGVPMQEIDNGLEFDADAQVALGGHINSKDMVPSSAYDPDAAARNIPSATPGFFPVIDAKYIFSRFPHPNLKIPVDDLPADSESYVSYLPPGRRTVYVLHVSE